MPSSPLRAFPKAVLSSRSRDSVPGSHVVLPSPQPALRGHGVYGLCRSLFCFSLAALLWSPCDPLPWAPFFHLPDPGTQLPPAAVRLSVSAPPWGPCVFHSHGASTPHPLCPRTGLVPSRLSPESRVQAPLCAVPAWCSSLLIFLLFSCTM